jgi:hypothetical protein
VEEQEEFPQDKGGLKTPDLELGRENLSVVFLQVLHLVDSVLAWHMAL